MNARFTLFFAGLLLSALAMAQETVTVTDATLTGDSATWTANNVYLLDGLVYLEEGGVLTIEAGTVIKGLPKSAISTGDNASALIISRGAQIFANGTEEAPIIFTADGDDTENPNDFNSTDRGLWGGLILLGNAPITFSADENGIEGIASNELRARYGGTDPEDNSGRLKYVSIRHGGFALSANDEINGLTLGGVGSATEIDYIEVFANLDDGIEWFGGTVRVTHATVSYCGDDGMDFDTGWRGSGQYWFVLQGPNDRTGTGRAGEHDGAIPDGKAPFSQPTIYNATYIGIGNGQTTGDGDAADAAPKSRYAILFRDNSGGYYYNSIFTDFNGAAVAIEQRNDDTPDSYDRLIAGDLAFRDNLFFNFEAGTQPTDLFIAVNPDDEKIEGAATQAVADNFMANNNRIINPDLNSDSIPRDDIGGNIDPRPFAFGLGASGASVAIAGFDTTAYYGAFDVAEGASNISWITGWTALSEQMITNNIINSISQVSEDGLLLEAPVPNPASVTTRINFELPTANRVSITVVDMLGRPLARRTNQYGAGVQSENIDVQYLPNGTYFVILDAPGTRLIQKMAVNH